MSARPIHVVAHLAISLDGATSGFEVDVARYYELVSTWDEDVTLVGADTILAQEEALVTAPAPGPTEGAPVLAVVDSRGRVSAWEALRDCGHWSKVVALRARRLSAPAWLPQYEAACGDRVDLGAALALLAEHDQARVVRVDSGGTLAGALLERDLVAELSLLVHPFISPDQSRWYADAELQARRLEALEPSVLAGGLVWLRYKLAG